MSVHERLADAQCLYEQGRYDGALTILLIAVAATSRKRFTHAVVPKDGDAFSQFVDEEFRTITGTSMQISIQNMNVEHQGQAVTIGRYLYRLLRNRLIHEGRMPEHIRFVRHPLIFIGKQQGITILNHYFLQGLANAVLLAPENAQPDAPIPQLPEVTRENVNSAIIAWMTQEPIDFRRTTQYVLPPDSLFREWVKKPVE